MPRECALAYVPRATVRARERALCSVRALAHAAEKRKAPSQRCCLAHLHVSG